MKVRKTSKPGKVEVELGSTDEALLEKAAASAGKVRLRTILLPVDFSKFGEKAISYASAFAEQFGASVHLVHVVEPVVYPENYLVTSAGADDVNAALLQTAEQRLERLAAERFSQGIEVERSVRMGRPFIEITEAARECQADLIILATHGYTGLKHVLLGSTAERVVRHASCPVLTVRDAEHDFVPCE